MVSRISSDFNQDVYLDIVMALWSWDLSQSCNERQPHVCIHQRCIGGRIPQLQRYFAYYNAIVSTYMDATPANERRIETHEDLFQVVSILKSNPDATLSELCRLTFANTNTTSHQTDGTSQVDAVALGVKALLMIDPSALHHSSDRLEKGTYRIHWKEDVPLSKYVQDSFPLGNHNVLSYNNSELFADIKKELRAVNLKKRLGITISATSDIRNHLHFDRKNNYLEVYHYTTFLKEQLRVTRDVGDCSSPSSSLKRGVLPRQLVLEILDSLQGTLFPLSDPRSKKLLRSLISKCSFDPDVLNFEVSSVRRVGEESVPYVYLAERLADLYNELQTPRPRGWLQQSMQRKSGARHVMMATLIGVIFAVLLGIASLAVSSYQAWIAYQAWKHPVQPS
ncbi:uncharacterized protein FFB20_08330 [Fusarium fujikuroi]|uniref:Uncharacterized protein n=1 Tax=Fusarium fujikuroi TaxID=5127 RepID=A0A2H3RPW1_FUSFU|nr:uncharacterized protein Y057_14798 [Fusarium fujikuroi]QGI75239.1 hypothetical protein CEK25_000145 [Fusarium fujikuroi]SCN74349.1 uncharacterized protein FFC1_02048 [Fusarium fujikuroi]SCN88548.1 uncharacterized protein FFB20_08330 [Fusarium fujikuroi]SCO08693.1 uncharacterized protein FFE2_11620 [Fusarium fujikuroi]